MEEIITTSNNCTFFNSTVEAGSFGLITDESSSKLDISKYLIDNKTTTYFVRVKGDSMEGAGIFSGDLLIVDRSKKASTKKIVIAYVNGEFTVKRLILEGNKTFLHPENPKYKPTEITEGMDFEIFGVVTFNIHKPL